jgi:hypothetical protein
MAGNAQFSVLPQFQGNLYDLQTKQAIAQALIQKGLQGDLQNYQPAGGGFAYVPKYGAGSIAAQLGNALLGNTLQRESGEGLSQLGAQQAAAYQQMFAPTTETAQATVQTPIAQQVPGAFGVGQGGGFTAGSPDAGQAALGNALAPQVTRTTQSPMNPMGMAPQSAAMLAQMMGMPEFAKTFVAPSYKPTDATLAAQQGGFDPRLANQAQFRKDSYVAPTAGAAGTVYRDPFTNKVISANPNIGEGMQAVYDANGNPVGAMPIAGYNAALQGRAGAEAMGKASAEPISGVDAAGNPVFTTKAAAAQGGGQGPQPAAGRFGGYQAPGAPVRPGLSPAEQEGQIGLAKGNVGMYNTLKDTASNSAERTNILDVLNSYAQGKTQYGPGWTGRIENLAALNSKLPSGLAFGSDEVSNAQVVQKLASNLIQQYQKSMGGTGTDKQFELVMHGTPGADMTNKAMQEVIPKLKSMEVALQAKANAADSWLAANNNNPASLNKFETTWRQNYDPRIYQLSMMSPAERQQKMAEYKDAPALKAKIQTALNNGWVQ